MSVKISSVVKAYSDLLGREPESFDAIASHLRAPSDAALRHWFITGREFQQTHGVFWVGQHLEEFEDGVDYSATSEQMAEMIARTSATWRELGRTEPYWSVITDPSFLSQSIAETADELYASGQHQIKLVMALLHRNDCALPKQATALDFGCGVGRLSLALAPSVDRVIGVDISEPHLEHARRRQAHQGISNVEFRIIGPNLDDVATLPKADLIISFIVLQHNPPPIIAALLAALLARLNPGGLATFQLPVYSRGYVFSAAHYLAAPRSNDMEMHVLPQRKAHAIIREAGCEVIEIREDTMVWSADYVSQTFLVRKAR
jgi:2-polyprenyl-3-methyl-5-hydroxy-6-metoxy-1,4-benzoquinol methylase